MIRYGRKLLVAYRLQRANARIVIAELDEKLNASHPSGIRDVLTGDAHFRQVGLGFPLLP